MSTTITQGSKENMIVQVVDLLGVVNDLSSSTPTYTVYKNSTSGTVLYTNAAATAIGDTVYCLIDTSTGSGISFPTVPVTGWWGIDIYLLYLKFTVSPEVPRLGPYTFNVTS